VPDVFSRSRDGRSARRVDYAARVWVEHVPDVIFEHPRLTAIYDAIEPDRTDLDVYVDIAGELGARRVLDVGCGTGTFALHLAGRGLEVTGLDPARGSLDVARSKPGADQVRWIHGDARALPPTQVDLATMTGNVAQAIVEPADWDTTLRCVYEAPSVDLCPRRQLGAARSDHELLVPTATGAKVVEIDTGFARPVTSNDMFRVTDLTAVRTVATTRPTGDGP
jgi:SAM-dependent methyltransferase